MAKYKILRVSDSQSKDQEFSFWKAIGKLSKIMCLRQTL